MELGVSFTGFFVALGIEPRASHTLDKRPSTELHSLSFGYFLFGVRVSLRCPCRALNLRSSFLNAPSRWDFVCVPPSPDHHSGFNPALLADLGRQSEESPLPDVIASQVYQDRTGKPGPVLPSEGRFGPAATTTTVLQGAFRVLACHIRCYQTLCKQRARPVHNAGLAPAAGEMQAILRSVMSLKRSHLAGDSVCLGLPVWSLTWKEVFGGPGKQPWVSLLGS